MKLAKLCITIAMLLTLVTARPQDITASSKPCASREANQLLERGHATFPTSGYGTPPIVAAAGKALAYFELAVEKDPVCAQTYVTLAWAESGFPSWPGLPPRERFPKVKEAATKAIELESNNAAAHALLGGAAFNTGEWEQAEKELQRAMTIAPKWAYAGEGKWPEARNAFQTALPLSDRDAGLLMSLAYVDAADGRRQEVSPLLEEAKQKTAFMYVPVYRIAAAYISLGDKDQALAWLQKAYVDDFDWMVWLKVDPVMDPLRSDPRFHDLLSRMKFPQ